MTLGYHVTMRVPEIRTAIIALLLAATIGLVWCGSTCLYDQHFDSEGNRP